MLVKSIEQYNISRSFCHVHVLFSCFFSYPGIGTLQRDMNTRLKFLLSRNICICFACVWGRTTKYSVVGNCCFGSIWIVPLTSSFFPQNCPHVSGSHQVLGKLHTFLSYLHSYYDSCSHGKRLELMRSSEMTGTVCPRCVFFYSSGPYLMLLYPHTCFCVKYLVCNHCVCV